jgi:hypothetical protein
MSGIEPRISGSRLAGPGARLAAAGAALSGAGGALVAAAATACCAGPILAPLVVAVLGAGGSAWAAGLKPYSPWLLAASAVMLGFGFWSAYLPRPSCELSGAPTSRWADRAVRSILWLSALLWVASIAVHLLGPSRGAFE